ncbi:MAG: RpoL/Rpb11 RNA polymerase subunit family protein [bacterium]
MHFNSFIFSIPHPSENRMVIRLQCVQGKKSNEVFKKGLNSLNNLCSNLISKLEAE